MTFPKLVKIHDLVMTIQISNSDSGLFRFIHDCGNPAHRMIANVAQQEHLKIIDILVRKTRRCIQFTT